MPCAALLSLEDVRDPQRRAERRQRLHHRCDHWLHQREDRRQDRPPTLEALTPAVFALRPEWTQAVPAGLVEHTPRAVVEPRTAACPRCGQTWSARGPQERPVETWVGASRLRRPYGSCAPCRCGSAPLEAALELAERRKPPEVQKAAVALTKEIPSETACARCEPLTGWPLRAPTAHAVPHAVAEGWTVLAVAPTPEEIVAKIAAVAAGQSWRPILVLASDGAAVPTRPETAKGRRPGRQQVRAKRARWTGPWRAAKGCRCSLLEAARIGQVLSWHHVQTEEALAAARQQVQAAGSMPDAQVRLCVLADGAPWIWTQAQALFPSAVEVLDDDHGCDHLHHVAPLQYGAQPDRQQAWHEAAVTRLFWGAVHGVIWGRQRMQPTDAHAAAAMANLRA